MSVAASASGSYDAVQDDDSGPEYLPPWESGAPGRDWFTFDRWLPPASDDDFVLA